MNAFFESLSKKDVEFEKDVLIKKYSSVRIGGIAAAVVFPDTEEKLLFALEQAKNLRISYKILGRMSNILPCDEYYNGAIIFTTRLSKYELYDNVVYAESGLLMSRLIRILAKQGIGGCESLVGIPGTVGGMIKNNAGAFGSSMSSILRGAKLYFPNTQTVEFWSTDRLQLRYRSSILHSIDAVILGAELEMQRKDCEQAKNCIERVQTKRKELQPSEASLGCTFKKHDGISAGQIIDECGLKGLRVGGASVSDKHAGFIVNLGNATSADYRALMQSVSKTVFEKKGIFLEPEIELF